MARRINSIFQKSTSDGVSKQQAAWADYVPLFETPQLNAGSERFIETIIPAIEKKVDQQGLYRVSGSLTNVRELQHNVEKGKYMNFDIYKVHEVASLLKQFFRTLPEPLFTFDLYEVLVEAIKIEDAKTRLMTLFDVLRLLPPANFTILSHLMAHLEFVSYWKDKNGMSRSNLAIVFGPSLMRSSNPDPLIILDDAKPVNELITLFMQYHSFFFDSEDDDEEHFESEDSDEISSPSEQGSPEPDTKTVKKERRQSREAASTPKVIGRDAGKRVSLEIPIEAIDSPLRQKRLSRAEAILFDEAIKEEMGEGVPMDSPKRKLRTTADKFLSSSITTPPPSPLTARVRISTSPPESSASSSPNESGKEKETETENGELGKTPLSKSEKKGRRRSAKLFLSDIKQKHKVRKEDRKSEKQQKKQAKQEQNARQKLEIAELQQRLKQEKKLRAEIEKYQEEKEREKKNEETFAKALTLRRVYEGKRGKSVASRAYAQRGSIDKVWAEGMNQKARKIELGEYTSNDLDNWLEELERQSKTDK